MPRLSSKEVEPELREITDPYSLGVHLGVPPEDLEQFERDYPLVTRRRSQVITYWLRSFPEASWSTLASAVERVGGHRLLVSRLRRLAAEEVRGNNYSAGTDEDDDELDYGTPPESTVDDVEDNVFDHIASLPSLNAGSLMDDDSLLASATDKLRLEFSSLFTKVRLSLKKLGVSPESFLSHLKSVEAFGHSFETVFISRSETFASTISRPLKSFEDIFPAIAPYCSWFNHLLIENILDTFCDDDEKIMQKWQRFKGKFTKYCEARLCKCPLDRFGEDSTSVVANTTSVVMKIDTHWKTVKVKQICVIRDTISELLQIKPYNLYLRAVQNGCVELLLYVPMFVAERFIPPSAEQVVALKKACVVQVRCDPDFATRRYDMADISSSIAQPLTMKDFSNLEDVAQYLSANALEAYREFVQAPALEIYNHLKSISLGHSLRVMGDSLDAKLQDYGPFMLESALMFGFSYMLYADYLPRPANTIVPAIYLGGAASAFVVRLRRRDTQLFNRLGNFSPFLYLPLLIILPIQFLRLYRRNNVL